ncbi:secretin N-terminal domain-containing protein, partial [Sphingobium jiangsuense]
ALMAGGGEGNAAAATVAAIDASNSIVLRGQPGTVARLAQMARDLDRQAASGTDIRVYWLDHADADKLMPVLQQLLGQGGGAVASAPVSGGGQGGASASAAPAP